MARKTIDEKDSKDLVTKKETKTKKAENKLQPTEKVDTNIKKTKKATTTVSKKTTKTTSKTTKKNDSDGLASSKSKTVSKTVKSTTPSKTTKTKKTSTKKTTTKKVSTVKKSIKSNPISILEYYDLPYTYEKTVVKILAQTPNNLFIYWEISTSDRKLLKDRYGYTFFESTYPVLLITNTSNDYTFEVQIDDFANSWYLNINDSKCDYIVKLGRKYYEKPINSENDYVEIYASNQLEVPNDHILFNTPFNSVHFKNTKTGKLSHKNLSTLISNEHLKNVFKVDDLYSLIYENTSIINGTHDLSNPSSATSLSFTKEIK